MARILFGAVGALTALAATAAQSGHGAHAQTIDENTVRGPRDVTALTNRIPSGANNAPSVLKCTIRDTDRRARTMAFSGMRPLFYTGNCQWTDIKRWEERLARAVRERLGDPGRH